MINELSVEDAIELLKEKRMEINYQVNGTTQFSEALDIAIKALEQTRWIPCSERLPEESGDYLVTTKWKGSYSGEVYIETNMAVYRKKSKEWDCVDVIAWKPLPQPYAESEEDE